MKLRSVHMAAFQLFHVASVTLLISNHYASCSFSILRMQATCVIIKKCVICGSLLIVFLISGTKRERGLLAWNQVHDEDSSSTLGTEDVYDLPFGITSCLSSQSWVRYIPFCPQNGHRTHSRPEDKSMSQSQGSHSPEVIDEIPL